MPTEEKPFGPDVTIPSDAKAVAFWAEISSTDDSGITVDGVKEGDLVEIVDVAGICSFDDKTTVQRIAGIVGIVTGVLSTGLPLFGATKAAVVAKAFGDQANTLKGKLGNPSTGGKRRDGYGEDLGSGHFAKHEGGILVCLPSARGVLFATPDNYLADGAKERGRLPEYFSKNVTDYNCFFPCRREGGLMEKKAERDGPVHIIAFDSKFTDNAGKYVVKFRVIRPTPDESADQVREELTRLGAF